MAKGFPFRQFIKELKNSGAISDGNPFSVDDGTIRKEVDQYGQFNGYVIRNASLTDIDVRLDGDPDKEFRVFSGQGSVLDPREGFLFRELTITRVNAVTINANEVSVQYQRLAPVTGIRGSV